ncbi:hypothetical protein LCGC14_0658080 [marine sediment metagenome]|uniref:Uncharacterized protein n=1 Tax=marine sediment metagenome TaxID=412755 RepID=A0A0F9QZF9_9ZZZZ
MMTEIRGRLHRSYSPTAEIGDMEKLAEEMVGKPVTITDLGLEIGTIVSTRVEGDYIVWKAELHHHGQTISQI